MMAYVLMNYDIESIPERPANMWIREQSTPPVKETLRVRKLAAPFAE
jgi:hypothetical protein